MRSAGPARSMMSKSRERFVVSRRSEVGLALAVLASVTTFTLPAWAFIGPMALGNVGVVWTLCVWVVAAAFIVAAWFAEDHPLAGQGTLLAGAAVLTGVGLISGRIAAAWEFGPLFGVLALTPAVLGLLSALLIGRVHQPLEELRVASDEVNRAPLRIRSQAETDGEERDAIRRAS